MLSPYRSLAQAHQADYVLPFSKSLHCVSPTPQFSSHTIIHELHEKEDSISFLLLFPGLLNWRHGELVELNWRPWELVELNRVTLRSFQAGWNVQ